MTENTNPPKELPTRWIVIFFISIVIGISSGLLGVALALTLHGIQHLAFGYSLDQLVSDESFFTGVNSAAPARRVIVLIGCGLIASFGWYTLYQFGKPLVSISDALKTNKKMPYLSTICHVILQMSTIALGSPLGREVAPRELSALFATWFSQITKLTPQETKIMIACAAGAGLAAVYNVPLGGALFTLEVLLCTFSWPVVLPALLTSALATLVSWWGLGNQPLYFVPATELNTSILMFAIVTGPIYGFVAYWFIKVVNKQKKLALHDKKMIIPSLLNFFGIGLLAIYFPVLLGNGKSPVQMEFTATAGIAASALLLTLRSIITWSSFRVGAQGGILTPSLANGALLATVLGGLWSYCWPSTVFESFVVIGATAFLAGAQRMPITAVVLIFEFTHIQLGFLVPIILAVAGSIVSIKLCEERFEKTSLIIPLKND